MHSDNGILATVPGDFVAAAPAKHGTSVWGWLGIAAGACCSYLIWRLAEGHPSQPMAAAVVFVVVFTAFLWQELRKK